MILPDEEFIEEARSLEAAYLQSDDPIVQSGFSGGRDRWVAERSPIVEAIDGDGDFLDVGCANGLLAADVVVWAEQRGHTIAPHGVDIGDGLIEVARRNLAEHAANFAVVDAWRWEPERQWRYVYSLLDLAPADLWCEWIEKLLGWVESSGRLIIGSYGSRSREIEPVDPGEVLARCGVEVVGRSSGGQPPVSRFAWAVRNNPRIHGSSGGARART